VANGIFSEGVATRGHHTVTDLPIFYCFADLLNFASPFKSQRCARAANIAV
jgi:hypothetical protein